MSYFKAKMQLWSSALFEIVQLALKGLISKETKERGRKEEEKGNKRGREGSIGGSRS